MLLDQAALFEKARKFELQALNEYKLHPGLFPELEVLLLDIYASLRPSASEYERRTQLVQAYNMITRSIFGNTEGFPVVEAFGSFIMDIFTVKSDLDLSVNFNNSSAALLPRHQIISVLRRIAKVLYKLQRKGHVSGVFPVLHARVPVLKAVDCKTGIECDVSVENKDGISRSLFFSIISSIDERFCILSYLLKAWAKANDINSSKDHTMNSLSIISFVAFHLQTRDPPIMPPFSTLLKDGTGITNLRSAALQFKNFGRRNKESVSELFVALLAKLSSVEQLWKLGLCVSTFEGSWISKTWDSRVGNMSVEDFLDRTQNFARSVGKSEMIKIYECIRSSLKRLSDSRKGQLEASGLGSVLFGTISLDTPIKHTNNNTVMGLKQKLLPHNESIQPCVVKESNRANSTAGMNLKRKRPCDKSSQPCVDSANESGHANFTAGMSLTRELPFIEPVWPRVETITPSSHAHNNAGRSLEQKHPSSKSVPLVKTITHNRVRHSEVTRASYISLNENQSNIYFPHPIPPYVPPPHIHGAGQPDMSFLPYGYLTHPMPPFASSAGHGSHNQMQFPFANHLVNALQYQTASSHAVHIPCASQGLQYAQNLVHPILDGSHQNIVPDCSAYNTGHPQHLFVPPRSSGPYRR